MSLEILLAKIIATASTDIILANYPILKTAVNEGIDRAADAVTKSTESKLRTILDDLLKDSYYDDNREHYIREIQFIYNNNPPPISCHASNRVEAYEAWVHTVTDDGHIQQLFFAVRDKIISLCWEDGDYWKKVAIENFEKHEYKVDSDSIYKGVKVLEKPPITIKGEKTDEYREHWNEAMFLSVNDENGIKILQKDIYVPPTCYKTNDKQNPCSATEYLMDEAMNPARNRHGFVIFGNLGAGKSTLITWFLNHYDDCCKQHNIKPRTVRVFQFKKWQEVKESVSNSELEDTILFLDGFDEVNHEKENNRERQLITLYSYYKDIKDFTLFVTCRVGYLNTGRMGRLNWITLMNFSEDEIDTFVNQYKCIAGKLVSENTLAKIKKDKQSLSLFGVPYYLCAVLALESNAEEICSNVDIFDCIFNVKDGIYKQSLKINNRTEYYDVRCEALGDTDCCTLHKIACEVAFYIFENNPEDRTIPMKEYQKILEKFCDYEKRDLIDKWFRSIHHVELSSESLSFEYKTYEYFVAVYLFTEIFTLSFQDYSAMNEAEQNAEKEKRAKAIIHCFKKGKLQWDDAQNSIAAYLQRKMEKKYKETTADKEAEYMLFEEIVALVVKKGISYFELCDESSSSARELRTIEAQTFCNAIDTLSLLSDAYGIELLFNEANRIKKKRFQLDLISAIRHAKEEKIELMKGGIDLSSIQMREEKLCGISLHSSYLADADFSSADLRNANFENATIAGANFEYADLRSASFENVLLEDNLDGHKRQVQFGNAIICEEDICQFTKDDWSMKIEFDTIIVDGITYNKSDFLQTFSEQMGDASF